MSRREPAAAGRKAPGSRPNARPHSAATAARTAMRSLSDADRRGSPGSRSPSSRGSFPLRAAARELRGRRPQARDRVGRDREARRVEREEMDRRQQRPEQADQGRPDRARQAHRRAHEPGRGLQRLAVGRDAGQGRLQSRVEEGAQARERQGHDEQERQGHASAVERRDGQEHDHRAQAVHGDHRPAMVPAVGPMSADQAQDEEGPRLRGGQVTGVLADQADGQPDQRDAVDLVADRRQCLAAPQ